MSLIYTIIIIFLLWNLLQYAERNLDKIKIWLMRRKFKKRMDDCKCQMCSSQNAKWEIDDLKPKKTKEF